MKAFVLEMNANQINLISKITDKLDANPKYDSKEKLAIIGIAINILNDDTSRFVNHVFSEGSEEEFVFIVEYLRHLKDVLAGELKEELYSEENRIKYNALVKHTLETLTEKLLLKGEEDDE